MTTRPRKGERRFVLRGDGKSELYMRDVADDNGHVVARYTVVFGCRIGGALALFLRVRGIKLTDCLEVLAVLLSFQVLFHLPRSPAGRAYRFTEFLLRDAEALLPIGNLIGLPDVDAGFIAVVSLFRRVDTSHQLLLSRALAVADV